jgi:hypothetical protein
MHCQIKNYSIYSIEYIGNNFYSIKAMSSIGGFGRFFETARTCTAWWNTPNKNKFKTNSKQKKSLIKLHKWIKSSSKKNIFIFWGALGRAVHQAVSKKPPKPPMLDIPFWPCFIVIFIIEIMGFIVSLHFIFLFLQNLGVFWIMKHYTQLHFGGEPVSSFNPGRLVISYSPIETLIDFILWYTVCRS